MKKDCKIYNGKWYEEPEIYDKFSTYEDFEGVCFKEISKILAGKQLNNPIDLCAGTGRATDYLLSLPFKGMVYAVEKSDQMCAYLEKKYDWRVVLIKAETANLIDHPLRNNIKSNLIVSRFGFPSKIWDKKQAWEELVAVDSLLEDDGLFITIGWDEEFNDELNEMFYKHVPDGIQADSFDEWKEERKSCIRSPRNAHLTWLKTGIETKLAFPSLQESVYIMGTLFGESALKEIVENNKTEWSMRMSITINDKSSIQEILKNYERK